VERPVSAIEVEPVESSILDHPLSDLARAHTRHAHIGGKAETRAVRPAIAIKLAAGMLVQGPRGHRFRLQAYQLIEGGRGEGVSQLGSSKSIDDRIEHPQTQHAHGCVGLKPLRAVVDFIVTPSLTAMDEISEAVIFAASIIEPRSIR
jgi:hypothetical protein